MPDYSEMKDDIEALLEEGWTIEEIEDHLGLVRSQDEAENG